MTIYGKEICASRPVIPGHAYGPTNEELDGTDVFPFPMSKSYKQLPAEPVSPSMENFRDGSASAFGVNARACEFRMKDALFL